MCFITILETLQHVVLEGKKEVGQRQKDTLPLCTVLLSKGQGH